MSAPVLHYHPFAAFCWKALIALYEKDVAFDRVLVDLGDSASAEAFRALWPHGKFPVLVDAGEVIPESTIIVEYLDLKRPEPRLIPADPAAALDVRFWDRFFDAYVAVPMQEIVADSFTEPKSPPRVAAARATLRTSYDILEKRLASREWACVVGFSLADIAAAPALFYADWVEPFHRTHPALNDYYRRLRARPSIIRTVDEARPYRHFFPLGVPDWAD
ncbi:glutathione S-transferase family protein [Sphingomonas sp. ID0503]|uniref:glutathione S-transferase family protein n=1 Tax=Sphingomonas sp. ID0503 TaxID=3399691 RepID=UPI003AFAFC59